MRSRASRSLNGASPEGARTLRRAAHEVTPFVRDMPESPFAAILSELVARIPGGKAAILVDHDGEAVDYFGDCDPYELKVAGAHWRVVFDRAMDSIAPVNGPP